MKKLTAISVLALGALTAFSTASANTVFTDRATFITAINPNAAEDFNSITVDTQFRTQSVVVGDFTITGEPGANGNGSNLIDAGVAQFSDTYTLDNTTYLLGDLSSPEELRIDFNVGVTAWGADFAGFSNQPRATDIVFYDAGDNVIGTISEQTSDNSSRTFLGIDLMGDVASYVILSNSVGSNDVFGIDNVAYNTAPVPVPGAAVLFGGALAGFFGRRLKK
ncbi:MAG: hypothetical protein AAGH41_02370 [Pseudomonadota bacterium]